MLQFTEYTIAAKMSNKNEFCTKLLARTHLDESQWPMDWRPSQIDPNPVIHYHSFYTRPDKMLMLLFCSDYITNLNSAPKPREEMYDDDLQIEMLSLSADAPSTWLPEQRLAAEHLSTKKRRPRRPMDYYKENSPA